MKNFFLRIALLSLSFPAVSFAAPLFSNVGDIKDKLCILAGQLYAAGLVVGVIFVIYAGIKYAAARGSEKSIGEAHEALKWAIIGIAVIIIAFGIPGIVNTTLGGGALTTECS